MNRTVCLLWSPFWTRLPACRPEHAANAGSGSFRLLWPIGRSCASRPHHTQTNLEPFTFQSILRHHSRPSTPPPPRTPQGNNPHPSDCLLGHTLSATRSPCWSPCSPLLSIA
ncbi:hypothetical protein VTI28DRAFT_741 [Corynascus sepedonium]